MWMYGDVYGMDPIHEKDPCRRVKKKRMEMAKPGIS